MDDKEFQQKVGESVVQFETVADPESVVPPADTPVTVDPPAYTPDLETQIKEAVVGGQLLQGEADKGISTFARRFKQLHPNQIFRKVLKKAA